MKTSGNHLFPLGRAEFWELMLDPGVLSQIIPGLQSVKFISDTEIVATATLGVGPLTGTFSGKGFLSEMQKPAHLKILGEGLNGTVGVIKASCILDMTEQYDSTLLAYQIDLQIGNIPTNVGQQFATRAINSILRRASLVLESRRQKVPAVTQESDSSNLGKAAQTWDEIDINVVRQVAWSSIQDISQTFIKDFSGAIPLTLFVHQELAKRLSGNHTDLKGAALVCGDMAAEKDFFETDQILKFSEVDGFDISTVSLAKYQTAKFRFNPHVIDCNNLVLEREKYNLIVTSHGAHHVYNLGNLFYQANKALKPGGLLYMVEWVGPKYLQVPRTNHWLASALLWTLFDRKTRTNHMGQVKGRWVNPPPEAYEPSESCNSPELVPQFLKYFQPIRMVYFGGLSYPIFEGIAQNIDQTNWRNLLKIKILARLEKILMWLGVIKPLFAMAVGEKRPGIF